jgi:hypothetical protein
VRFARSRRLEHDDGEAAQASFDRRHPGPEGSPMPFTALSLAHSPDADPDVHRSSIDTGLYRIHTVIVRDQRQGLEVCRRMVAEDGVQSVLLCPGHFNADVGEIAATLGEGISVSVTRGDPRGGRVAAKAMEAAGWFAAGPH